jgi:hypothetical protein
MGILSKILGEPAPRPAPLHHPSLGELRWQDEGWWQGVWTAEGETSLEFIVGGDKNGPSDTLVAALEGTLGRWREVNHRLKHFLESQGRPPSAASAATLLKPTGVCYLWTERPGCFTVELAMEGDEGAIGRVEFEKGEPKHLGRDD